MNSMLNIIQKYLLLTVVSIFLLTTVAFADTTEYPPFVSFTGNYVYGNNDSNELIISDLVFEGPIAYIDGTYSFSWMPSPDLILGASFQIGPLYNSSSDRLTFGPPPGGSPGEVSFTAPGFFSGTLDNFVVTQDDGTKMKQGHIGNLSETAGHGSKYVDDLFSYDPDAYHLNMFMGFTPYAGGQETFDSYATGNISGGLISVVSTPVVPEPVSTVLFMTGGAIFAVRRRFNKR